MESIPHKDAGLASLRGRNAIVYNPQGLPTDPSSAMQAFLRRLGQRYREILAKNPDRASELQPAYLPLIESLGLADAVYERHRLGLADETFPLQVGFFGPTQAGKSSVLNWTAGQALAEPSPLAGYTVHPQGFTDPRFSPWCERLERFLDPLKKTRRVDLAKDQLEAFSLDMRPLSELPGPLSGAVLWDTPDFDSVRAGLYRETVLRIAALSDVIVLVVSKDKYGDLSVWDFLRLIEPLGQPTLLVINKTDPDSSALIIRSAMEKWTNLRLEGRLKCLALPYLLEDDAAHAKARSDALHAGLIEILPAAGQRPDGRRAMVERSWARWVHPLYDEYRLEQHWQKKVDAVLEAALERYQRDYLDHPHHYETFQRALGELLTLLEMPGIGAALHSARRVMTWPIRQLTRLGQTATGRDPVQEGVEWQILHQVAQHALLTLAEGLLLEKVEDPKDVHWWRGLSQHMSLERPALLAHCDAAARQYITDFKPEIEATAQGLYVHLQQHPLILNSLRATRVTTDAAALGVALHTGGIGVQDFVIAPAVLSMTTLLTESALGHFMTRAQEQLKLRQKEKVRSLLATALGTPLIALTASIDPDVRLGIPREALETVKETLL